MDNPIVIVGDGKERLYDRPRLVPRPKKVRGSSVVVVVLAVLVTAVVASSAARIRQESVENPPRRPPHPTCESGPRAANHTTVKAPLPAPVPLITKRTEIKKMTTEKMTSDVSQGPGWWQAADLKWSPPQRHPDYVAPPPPPPRQQPSWQQPVPQAAGPPRDHHPAGTRTRPASPARCIGMASDGSRPFPPPPTRRRADPWDKVRPHVDKARPHLDKGRRSGRACPANAKSSSP